MATEGTKFQVNYKLADGTLINLYAASVTELETGLADLAMNAANIKATRAEFGGSSPAAAVAPTVESIAQQFSAARKALDKAYQEMLICLAVEAILTPDHSNQDKLAQVRAIFTKYT